MASTLDAHQKSEALIICLFGMIAENNSLNTGRLAQLSNALLNESATTNAVECRTRSYKAKARELLAAIENNDPIDTVAYIGEPKTPRKPKKESPAKRNIDGVKTGRVVKGKAAKSNSLASLTSTNLLANSSAGDEATVKEERVDDYLDCLDQNQAEI